MRPTLAVMEMILPIPPISLKGFPTCFVCRAEVVEKGENCHQHGGRGHTVEMLRRAVNRQIRFAVMEMMRCEECAEIPLPELRCHKCSWMRGAAMGIAGIGEAMGWEADTTPYMKIIGTHDPGWQKKVWPDLFADR